jgi:single-stranded-DNA-specific exonuclease
MSNKIIKLNKLLPFVAIGTIADCQSILEPTNRLLVKSGLKVLNNNKLYSGLENLISSLEFEKKIKQGYKLDSQDLGYVLSPILNASGRISHAKLSINTLIGNNKQEATNLIQINTERKEIVKSYMKDLDAEVLKQVKDGNKLIFLAGKWNKGIVGLLASRIQNQINLPTAIVSLSENEATGSFRAPEGYNLPQILSSCSEFLNKFGGHPQAAGFTLNKDRLSAFQNELVNIFNTKILSDNISDPNYRKIIRLSLNQLNVELIKDILELDPFGQDFPSPIIGINAAELDKLSYQEMSGGLHFKTKFNNLDFIFFNLNQEIKSILTSTDDKLGQIQFSVGKNFWNGNYSYQLIFQNYIKN